MAATPEPVPVRRYTADNREIETGHQIGSAAHRIPPDTERVEKLAEHQRHQAGLDEDEKDLTARFKEAFDTGLGASASNMLEQAEGAFTGAILAKKASSAAVVEDSKLTASERQARDTATHLADILEQRKLMTAQPAPAIDDELDEGEEPLDSGYITTEDGVYKVEDGKYTRLEEAEAEEEPPENQDRNDMVNNEFFIDARESTDESESDVPFDAHVEENPYADVEAEWDDDAS
jgi:hypothetical protein